MLVDNNSADNLRLMTLDVSDAATGQELATADVTRRMFTKANVYQNFSLDFDSRPGEILEFRVFYFGFSKVTIYDSSVV